MTDTEDGAMDIDIVQETPLTKEGAVAQKSIEGYVIIASNIHEEATEEEVLDFFENYGKVKNLHLNLDRQTGYVKGYALIEYANLEDAATAVGEAPQEELLGRIPSVDFAFVEEKAEPAERVSREPLIGGYVSRRERSPGRD